MLVIEGVFYYRLLSRSLSHATKVRPASEQRSASFPLPRSLPHTLAPSPPHSGRVDDRRDLLLHRLCLLLDCSLGAAHVCGEGVW